jgi:hypothetical protein
MIQYLTALLANLAVAPSIRDNLFCLIPLNLKCDNFMLISSLDTVKDTFNLNGSSTSLVVLMGLVSNIATACYQLIVAQSLPNELARQFDRSLAASHRYRTVTV